MRFESASGKWSQISNSAIHHGLGIGVHIISSGNLLLANNTVFDVKRFGINIQSTFNATITRNIVSNIRSRVMSSLDGIIDVSAGIIGCGYNGASYCPNLQITHNIVSGVEMVGFSAPGHKCDDLN